jgi:hypothetical protein
VVLNCPRRLGSARCADRRRAWSLLTVGSSGLTGDWDMTVNVHEQGDIMVVEVVGEVDLLTVPRPHASGSGGAGQPAPGAGG